MRLVNVCPVSPCPPVSGGQVRSYHLLDRLRRRHELSLLCFYRSAEEQESLRWLATQGWDVRAVPFARLHPAWPATWGVLGRHLRALLGREPAGVTHWNQPAMRVAVAEVAARADVVHTECSYLAPYLLNLTGSATRITTALDLYSVTLRRQLNVATDWRLRWRLRRELPRFTRYEAWIAGQVDNVLVMSEVDAALLRRMNPAGHVVVVPNGVDTQVLRFEHVTRIGRHVLFVGSPGHAPNLDAANWVLTGIWPQLRRRCPEATLTLVNMDVPLVRTLADGQPGVDVTGQVPDVVPYYRRADLCLVPLRAGSGTRLKILEAMALGVPVLSTTVGVEGLSVEPGHHIALADTTKAFTDETIALLKNGARRHALAVAARALVEEVYEWDHIADKLEAVFYEAVTRHAALY